MPICGCPCWAARVTETAVSATAHAKERVI
jgi:hypothetical protein